ncbi:MAG: hypothetical protein NVS1B11_15050 [Terriglobales bacterium]
MNKFWMALLAVGLMPGCTSKPSTPAEKPQPKPAELETGRIAFQKMYIAAHGWARDAQPFSVQSQPTADSNGRDGKSAVWHASFGSVLNHGAKPYDWSGTDASDAPSRGISPGTEDTYSPTNSSTQVFDIVYLKVDSDKAFEVAQKHGGEKLLQKNPDLPVMYKLDWNHNTNELTWHVLYGTSPEDAKLRVVVNASTGEFMRVDK